MFLKVLNGECRLVLVVVMTTFVFCYQTQAGEIAPKAWITSSFMDFIDGSLSDGGVNTYISADGSIRLINLRDLNNDGNLDIPVCGSQGYNEAVDLFIYWSDKKGFSRDNKSRLPTAGAVAVTAADLNKDGYIELLVANRFDGEKTNLNSYIYWGNKKGFSASNRSSLPSRAAEAIAVADLNGDGFPDIVFANRGTDYHMTVDRFGKSFIYWGSKSGYFENQRSELETVNCSDVEIVDLDADGNLDIVFANEGNSQDQSGVRVYLGDGKGNFAKERTIWLPGIYSSAVDIADLNADGHLDIVVANKYRLEDKLEIPTSDKVDTYAVNSYIYWGSKSGYSSDSKTELPTIGAEAIATGDLNGDQLPDIFFANSVGDVSFVYWNSPAGFFSNKRLEVPTGQPTTDCCIEDINGDGYTDLVVANVPKENSNEVDSYIYWGTDKGLDLTAPTKLPTESTAGLAVADLNCDGRSDIVFANKLSGIFYGPTTSWIYWGDSKGRFSPDRRQGFPTHAGDVYVNADLNCDGFVDWMLLGSSSTIYWGSAKGLSTENKSDVPVTGKHARTGDFNRDGYLDLLFTQGDLLYGQKSGFSKANNFAFKKDELGTKIRGYPCLADLNRDGWLDAIYSTNKGNKVTIFWNSSAGFNNNDKTDLLFDGKLTKVLEIADLNADGFLDIIVAIQLDHNKPLSDGQAYLYHGNPNTESYICWGSANGYSISNRQGLPTVGSNDSVAADFNADGYIDLAFPSYHAGTHRQHQGYIYFNSANGFSPERFSLIPAPVDSGCGVYAADADLDGYMDLILANHALKDGDHGNAYVSIYYGSNDGFSSQRRQNLPTAGPHYFAIVDIGNIYTRSDRYDYISVPFDAGSPVNFKGISWQAQTPFRTRVEFQVRTAKSISQLNSAPWQGPKGQGSFYREKSALKSAASEYRWIQYKATLISPNSSNTPVLRSVTIEYD